MKIQHHGAVKGVTGSCHQLYIDDENSLLIDCGMFQGNETSNTLGKNDLSIDFDISTVSGLIVTHCHIDHVGRIPYLFAVGFKGPIYTSLASAELLPLVIEDALKVGVTRDERLIKSCLKLLKRSIVPLAYKQWHVLNIEKTSVKIKLQPAGHILGSAYVEVDINNHRVVFSGDLGAPYAPLLPAPKSPYRADTLVIESTYGDKNHENRKERSKRLKNIIEKAVSDNGVVLIPAFSIGRTQELLYEIEHFIHVEKNKAQQNNNKSFWQSIEIIVDSPMAANFTQKYREFKSLWDKEARRKLKQGRHPLNFEQLYTIDSHDEHLQTVNYLATRNKPAIVIAASGMCAGGRIMNYLEKFVVDKTADIIFVGYQAKGTLGRDIQKYGPRGGYVYINHKRLDISAAVHTISGYSAHADQSGLVNFAKRMRVKPKNIVLVHGDDFAKNALKQVFERELPGSNIKIGT